MSDNKFEGGAKLTYAALNQELLGRFPHFRSGYLDLLRMWKGEEPGPHIVFGDVLVPYLIDRLAEGSESPELISTFEFLEELLCSGDSDIRDVVGATVLEGLHGVSGVRAKLYMGPMTRSLAEQIEEAWG